MRLTIDDRPAADHPGHGIAPTLVFTHGMTDSLHHWDSVAAACRDAGARTVAWDLPGHGTSETCADPDDYGPHLGRRTLARIVDGVVDADDGPQQIVLVGHSLGGYLSCWYTIDHPERVAALVLIGAGPGFRNPESRQRWNDDVRRTATKAGDHALMGLHVDSHVIDHLTDIAAPTLVIVGTDDTAFLGSADYFERKLSDVERLTVPEAGHMVAETHPDAVADALVDFLRRRGVLTA